MERIAGLQFRYHTSYNFARNILSESCIPTPETDDKNLEGQPMADPKAYTKPWVNPPQKFKV